MTSMTDQEFAQTETLLRRRLAQLADHAPTTVHLPDEVPVVAVDRPTGRARRVGVIAAVTALIGAGGFTTYSFLGAADSGGAATPEEAVTTFVSAMEHEDVLGMIDVTLPEEVGALRAAIDSVTTDAKRVGLLADDFNASGVGGIDLSVDGLALDTEFLEGGLAAVTATGGTLNASFDPQAFPIGDRMRALLGGGTSVRTQTAGLGQTDPPVLLMTVERDGRWYVSVEYTVAEYFRRAADLELPGPVTRTPVAFDSPELAATGFYTRLAAFDLQGAFETFAPGEDAMAWLAQSWIADAQAAIERGRADGWTVGISGLTYETISSGDHLIMKPLTFKVEGTAPASYNPMSEDSATPLESPQEPTGSPQPFTIERADGCTTYTGKVAQSLVGPSPTPVVSPVDDSLQICDSSDVSAGLGLLLLGRGWTDLLSISVVQSGGQWYVSPLGTILAAASTSLHDTDDGASLFDSPLAPFIYGGLSRSFLESIVAGKPVSAIDPGCLPALTVEGDTVTGVVADPPVDAIRACSNLSFSSTSVNTSSGSGVEAPIPTEAPVATSP
jgi:hypothetical protein